MKWLFSCKTWLNDWLVDQVYSSKLTAWYGKAKACCSIYVCVQPHTDHTQCKVSDDNTWKQGIQPSTATQKWTDYP